MVGRRGRWHTDANQRRARYVRSRTRIAITYHFYSRIVEPYAVGTDLFGEPVLVAYQVSGGDEHATPIGWKRLNVGEIRSAMMLVEREPCGARMPPDEMMADPHAEYRRDQRNTLS